MVLMTRRRVLEGGVVFVEETHILSLCMLLIMLFVSNANILRSATTILYALQDANSSSEYVVSAVFESAEVNSSMSRFEVVVV